MKITSEMVTRAAFVLGRMSPTEKYFPIGVELAYLYPTFYEAPPKGLGPTFYHTGSYKGDKDLHMRLKSIVNKFA